MKNTSKFVMAIAVAAILTSCTVTSPMSASDAPIGTKTGVSSTLIIGVWQVNKNFGIAEAAKQGNITSGIAIADKKVTNFLIVRKAQILVYGK